MNTTAPDYAITKPGMPPKHRKLVRTYGRRTTSTVPETRSEPPAKRRRISQDDQNINVVEMPERDSKSSPKAEHKEEPSTDRDSHDREEQLDDKEKPKLSILSYFQPVKAVAGDLPSKNRTSPSSPPSPQTPPAVRVKRKRAPRLLKLRPTTQTSIEESSEDEELEESLSTPMDDLEESIRIHNITRVSKTDVGSILYRNGSPAESDTTSETSSVSRLKSAHKSLVQTTLNISSKAPFSECSLCNIVWNPFFPDDVKFHKNRHTAMLRVRKRKEESLI
ncbi:unnamed protein product [Clonostachys chloroleuca]|uniref:N-acetyltransferase ESCO zinc-finger domain-containing protein n=1 Tax=Clonostachys chloroleuca TaxID=1926264 RepID=A0AA35MBH9_9HYPO|nr:unnamed protein product [Clonostachys chloroleuca]